MAIDDDHITSILPQYRKQENPSTLDAALNQSIINITLTDRLPHVVPVQLLTS